MRGKITCRAALPDDAYALAELMIMAGDGMYEFLLEEMAPREMLAGLVARSVRRNEGTFCWKYCFVAESDQRVVGMINACPAVWLKQDEHDLLPSDRVATLEPIDRAQDWESYLIGSVAVRQMERRQGVAGDLVDWAVSQARAGSFERVSVNVWSDNTGAVALYTSRGFHIEKEVEVPAHPRLIHRGGSLLMVRELNQIDPAIRSNE